MTPPLFWRFVNAVRRWSEDRHVPEYNFVPQMRALWQTEARTPAKVIPINLLVVRRGQRKVA